jgi:hypothetical protein
MIPKYVEIIEANKRMEKGQLIFQMSEFNPNLPWTFLVEKFNIMFGTEIK